MRILYFQLNVGDPAEVKDSKLVPEVVEFVRIFRTIDVVVLDGTPDQRRDALKAKISEVGLERITSYLDIIQKFPACHQANVAISCPITCLETCIAFLEGKHIVL